MDAAPTTHLETDRLILRPWRPGEAGVQRRMWEERDPRVPASRRISPDGRPTIADIEKWIRRGPYEPEPGLLALERRTVGDVIGYCGLIANGNAPPDAPEIAFELVSVVHGNGYATEAGAAVVADAHRRGHLRLYATVREWNAASRRVLEKLGFAEVGIQEADPVHGDSLLTVLDLASR